MPETESPPQSSFHPYHPRSTRLGLAVGAALAVVVALMAAWDLKRGLGAPVWPRLVGGLLLLGAFSYVWWKLRPRPGYGALVTPMGVTFSRPLGGDPVSLGWSEVRSLNREGAARDTLVVHLTQGEWRLQARMFEKPETLESVARALEAHLPQRGYDA